MFPDFKSAWICNWCKVHDTLHSPHVIGNIGREITPRRRFSTSTSRSRLNEFKI